MGRLLEGELAKFIAAAPGGGTPLPPADVAADFVQAEALRESLRCLHCDCRKAGDEHEGDYPCRLRHWAQEYGVKAGSEARVRVFERQEHPLVIYESGKCIACGLCIQVAAQAGERLGLAMVGRGFDVRVTTPFGRSLEEG